MPVSPPEAVVYQLLIIFEELGRASSKNFINAELIYPACFSGSLIKVLEDSLPKERRFDLSVFTGTDERTVSFGHKNYGTDLLNGINNAERIAEELDHRKISICSNCDRSEKSYRIVHQFLRELQRPMRWSSRDLNLPALNLEAALGVATSKDPVIPLDVKGDYQPMAVNKIIKNGAMDYFLGEVWRDPEAVLMKIQDSKDPEIKNIFKEITEFKDLIFKGKNLFLKSKTAQEFMNVQEEVEKMIEGKKVSAATSDVFKKMFITYLGSRGLS